MPKTAESFAPSVAQFGSTMSPLELSWQTGPTGLYLAGHCGLVFDCAIAVTARTLTVKKKASASLRIFLSKLL
jgi:hypothetical protein